MKSRRPNSIGSLGVLSLCVAAGANEQVTSAQDKTTVEQIFGGATI